MYSWIWLFRRPSAGSFSGITMLLPFQTTVERSAENSVEICDSSKWRNWLNPITSS